jgi:hypothetical protein
MGRNKKTGIGKQIMDIKRFTASINNKSVLKNNRFEAQFGFADDSYMGGSRALDGNMLTLRCDSATLPGVTFASADGPPRLGYGPIEKHPYNPMFDDLSLTFMVDAGSQIHKMFYDWVSCIVNFEGYGASTVDRRSSKSPTPAQAYEVGYRDKYACTLTLRVFSTTDARTMTFTAYNVFPMALPQVGMNWGEGDILRLNIPFAYTDFVVDYASFRNNGPVETGVTPTAPSGGLARPFSETRDVGLVPA